MRCLEFACSALKKELKLKQKEEERKRKEEEKAKQVSNLLHFLRIHNILGKSSLIIELSS